MTSSNEQDTPNVNQPPQQGADGGAPEQQAMPQQPAAPQPEPQQKEASKKTGFMKKVAAQMNPAEEVGEIIQAHLPSDLVGGAVPHISGVEEETVWNAAAQACGTERVHYCYTVEDGMCWYLAAPSSAFASHPDSWCPLAAALPGNSEHWDRETVYLYEQEGAAGALRWDPESGKMQLFLGAARTILPRIQSMDANFVTIDADAATPMRWKNKALRQEQLSRALTRILMFSGLGVALVALLFWLGSFAMSSILAPQLEQAKELSKKASMDLLVAASNANQSNVHKHMVRVQELLDTLMGFGGTLVRYEVKGNKIEWEALVPPAMQGDIGQLKAKAVGLEDGRLRIKGSR